MPNITVLIADQHPVVREGVKAVLGKGFSVVGTCGDGREVLRLAKRYEPQVVITDIPMPLLNGLDAALRISKMKLSSKVIILSALDGFREIEHAVMAKVSGYLVKSEAVGKLAESVREVASGGNAFSPHIWEHIKEWGHMPQYAKRQPNGLSEREVDVVQLIAADEQNKNIAETLKVSISRVETLIDQIAAKIGIKGKGKHVRLQITLFAYKEGICSQ